MTLLFVLLAATLSLMIAGATHRALAGVTARRRTAWELDRAVWGHWIRRPEPAAVVAAVVRLHQAAGK